LVLHATRIHAASRGFGKVEPMVALGIFVGGRASRMGGAPKGLLPAPETGEPLVVRLARLGQELGLEPVLVGQADPYVAVLPGLRVVADEPAGIGPLGGLGALLAAAGPGRALAVACDMPFVSRDLLARLHAEPCADALAPRSGSRWEPLCAAYDAPRVSPLLATAVAGGVRSFQALFARLEVRELALSAAERAELIDWDTPEDVRR
jgi:molybdopterin-guanine dinucleotide biosynthesis protein A